MNNLFGVSMDVIMYVLVALLIIAVLSVIYVSITNRVMFKLGVRNIPRRRAQTTLIVLGLMLSTVIISAAFTTGDTVDRSITSQVYGVLGSMDEVIQPQAVEDDAFEDPTLALVKDQTFDAAAAAPLIAKLKTNPTFDYVIPAFSSLAVGINPDKRLSAPQFNIVGLDPASSKGLPDIESTRGVKLSVDQLGPGEIFINQAAADELDAKAGETISISIGEAPTPFRVKDIVKDKRLAGAGGISVRREGGLLPLTTAQEFFKAPGELTMIAISNKGDARGGYKLTKKAEAELNAAIKSQSGPTNSLAVVKVKETGVKIAEFGANVLTTFFLVFGLFSIGAGVLLIFLIFVMLAAERKGEMGMARAVGTRRRDIVQTFLAEGMAYNVGAAAVGAGIGVLVAFAMSQVMASLFAQIDINISPHVTPRSLIISYSLGVVLTFFTVTFSSWRVSFINIVRAIRDIPEPPTPKPMWGAHGFLPTLGALIFKPTDREGWIRRGLITVAAVLLGLAGTVQLLGIIAVLMIIAVRIWEAASPPQRTIGGRILAFFGGILLTPLGIFRTFQWGPLMFGLGIAIVAIFLAADSHSAFILLAGLSLGPLGLCLMARSFGLNERLTFTLTGFYLIYIWEIDFTFKLIQKVFGKTTGDIEMFFLSGVMVTVAATFVVVFNSDIILGPLTRLGSVLGGLLPSLKMAVAYPLANRARTGMTMAMFCLVVFALTVMSSMNHNFNRLYLSSSALGGYDIEVDEQFNSPIGDFKSTLTKADPTTAAAISAVGVTSLSTRFTSRVCEVRQDRDCSGDALEGYAIWGDSADFINNQAVNLQSRAHGYDSDSAVWQAVNSQPGTAIVDVNALGGGGFGTGFIKNIKTADTSFEPTTVRLVELKTGKVTNVKVIGVIQQGASTTYSGLHVSQATFDAAFSAPDARRFFVKTVSGTNNRSEARAIESAFLTTGAQAESIRKQLNDINAVQSGFFYLLQGFMGLGLFVGVAAVGVIAFRTVVERRQQIGMLRAIGYTRRMIGMTFLLESAFIAFAGVLSGVVFALILAYQLIQEQFSSQGITTFSVPWLQVVIIAGLAFGFALIMTFIPSRQAANIPIAAALRYE